MAGNFWQSSHNSQWILDKQDLIRERQHDLQILTEEEYQKVFIFFANVIQILGEQLKLRQQVVATATVYFKRFYARNSLKCIDPLLLAPTCIFLASKVEEFGVISNSRLISTCQTVIKNKFSYAYQQEFPYRTNHILECEFYLLENLDCCLIVYQPYRPLLQLIQDIGPGDDQLLTLTWRIINDSLRTDVSLLYPPYQVSYVIVFQRRKFIFVFGFISDCDRSNSNSVRNPAERTQSVVRRVERGFGEGAGDRPNYSEPFRIVEKLRREKGNSRAAEQNAKTQILKVFMYHHHMRH